MKKIYLFFLGVAISTATSAQVLVINEVFQDPGADLVDRKPGDANGDNLRGDNAFDDEFIELVNNSGGPLNIGGYRIYDGERYGRLIAAVPNDGPNHTVPLGTIIPAGAMYIVFGGGDVTAIDALPNVTAHVAITAPSEITREGWDGSRLDLQDGGDFVYILGPTGDNTIITSYDSDTDVGEVLDFNQSAQRSPGITGVFKVHTTINGKYFSPGVITVVQDTNQLVLNEVLGKPGTNTGDANNDNGGTGNSSEDEFLEIINNSGASIDISGYHVYDVNRYAITNPRRPKHVVPSGTILADGQAFVLFGGGVPVGTFGDAIVQVANGFDTNLSVNNTDPEIMYITDGSGIADLGNIVAVYTLSEAGPLDTFRSRSRDPEITGSFKGHDVITAASSGSFYSPGTKADGTSFLDLNVAAATGNFNVAGSWESGVPTNTIDAYIPSGVTVTVTSDNEEVDYLRVAGDLVIDAGKSLTVSGSLGVEGNVTVNSGGSLIVNGISAGNVTYNRELTFESGNLKGWHLTGSPVVGQDFDDAYATTNDLAISGTKRGLGFYDTAADDWSYLENDDSNEGTFSAGKGYTIKRASIGNVAFTGTLNIDNAGVNVVLQTVGNRFNALSNPYTSYINSATFLNDEAAISDTKTAWVWNKALGLNGAYEVKMVSDSFVIAPGQGFFVQANTGGGTFNFTESNQSHNGGSDTFQKGSSDKTEIQLWITDGTSKNYNKIYYLEDTTTGFDLGYEGELFSGTPNKFAIYSHLVSDSQGKNFQTQSLPSSGLETMIVPIGVNAEEGKEITFTADALNIPAGIKVFLEDRETNTFTRLDEANSMYTITLATTLSGIGRFYLHTAANVLSTAEESLENVSIYKTDNSTLRIAGLSQGKSTVKLFNILGKQVLNSSFISNGVKNLELSKLASGVYIVELQTETGKLNKKIILE